MKVTRYQTATQFLAVNQSFLEQQEVINSLILGLAIACQQRTNDQTVYLNISNEDKILFAGMQTVGRELIVYGVEEQQADYIASLVAYLKREGLQLPGINGPKELALKIGEALQKAFDINYYTKFRQMLYRLTKVEYNPDIVGQLELATDTDTDVVGNWMELFCQEAMNESNPNAKADATYKIKAKEVYLWKGDSAVTMTCIARPTQNGVTVSYVYTPIEYRKRGYASKIVAELSQLMLHRGYQFCTLFTDLDNPTSNRIYQKIGYEPIQEFRVVRFI